MHLAVRLVTLFLVLLPLNWVVAQDEVNLAVIGEINVTLDDNCQDLLIVEEVLTGDFDVDGDGTDVPLSSFTVIVEDNDQSNGAIIDGCGTYSFRVEAAAGVNGFTTGWGVVNAEDKTPPVILSTPSAPAGPLYCNDIDGINVNLLSNTVSRCYTVNTGDGSIVPGTLNAQLRDRLLAGGGLPTVTDNCSPTVEVCVIDIVEQAPVNPECSAVDLLRTFIVSDGDCPSASGEDNDPATTTYPITFVRPGLDDLNTDNIVDVVEIECDEADALGLAFGEIPAPRPQDLPFFPGPDGTTIPLTIGQEGSFCNIGVIYEDSPPVSTCDEAYKVVRTYTVLDWCNPGETEIFTQIVKIGDFAAPVFTAPTQDLDFDGIPDGGNLQFPTNAGTSCGAFIRLDDGTITLTDACSDDIALTASIYPNQDLDATPFGAYAVDLNDNNAEITDLIPAGTHLLRYTYRDECNNSDFADVVITISDGAAPVASCENGLNVSLSAGVTADGVNSLGLAVINPTMVDAGSYDACGNIDLAIGRVEQNADGSYQLLPGASYGPRVDLTCEDLGTVVIGLEVTDGADNRNYCWMNILVEDKQVPDCLPPPPINLTCAQFEALGLPTPLSQASSDELDQIFGTATGLDNCSVTVFSTTSGEVNSCGSGSYTRSFRVIDGSGNAATCQQQITVTNTYDYTISFPGDTDAFCLEAPNLADITSDAGACDLIIKDAAVDTFLSQSDECYLLRVTHTVINFCEYNTLGEPYQLRRDADGDGDLSERLYVHLLPNDPFDLEDDVAILDMDANRNNGNPIPFAFIPVDDGDDNDGSDDNNSNDSEDSQSPDGVGFAYAQDDSRGAFRYYQFISVFDEVAPELTTAEPDDCFAAQSVNCTGSVTLGFTATDVCTANDQLGVRVELDQDFTAENGFSRTRFLLDGEVTAGTAGNYTVSLANVPVGSHAIRIRVTDNCGNFDARILEFCVSDELAPTPICIGQLTVTLMPNGDGTGNAAVWASDFIASDVEDCSGEVTYSIYTEEEASGAGFEAVPGRTGIILDCDSDATTPVRVYAFDPAGRGDFCSVFVLVQQAENACQDFNLGNLGGVILSEYGGVFANVAVTLDTEVSQSVDATDATGTFLFQDLPQGDDYTISAGLDTYISHSQGVSTFDLVLITQHILGQAPMTSAYQLLAADVNNDQEVTVQDLIAIRRLILGYDEEYPNNEPYRFVDANFIFPINTNPWATSFPEVVNVNNLNGNVFDADMIGIMIGDVSGDGLDNLLGTDSAQPRSGAVALAVEEQQLVAGQTYEVAIRAGAAADLLGLQGTIRVAPGTDISGVGYGAFTAAEVNAAYAGRGQLAFSYSERALAANDVVLTLELTATEDALLSEVLALSDGRLHSEGYRADGSLANLAFRFATTTGVTYLPEDFTVVNFPNPMREQATISYVLPEAVAADLTVRDLNGRVVTHATMDAAAGQNVFRLNRADLGAAGVYTYTLRAGDFTTTRKLVVE